MNKYFNSLIFVAALLLVNATHCVSTPTAFAKLASKITKNAEPWSQNVMDSLDSELQLAWANFFALLQDGQPSKALIKCAEYIEAHEEMVASSQQLAISTIQTLQEYSEKIEEKIQELVTYINAIYYEYIYNHIAQKTSSAPLYMFDENGVVAKEKRAKTLPRP